MRGPRNEAPPPFRHGPVVAIRTVQRHVDRAVLLRISGAAPPRARVVRREDAADEGDYREAGSAVVAQAVEVPPTVARGRNVVVEVRSVNAALAASRPDVATIGMPAPGCTPPPARYSPGIRVLPAGR